MNYEYYYNNVPGSGLCRNNLIYTSLMSANKKVFVQWYYNDTYYHKDQNQVVDPKLMDQKFEREVKYLRMMEKIFPEFIPKILDIDLTERKIYLQVDGPDFWELAGCDQANFDKVLPDWREQMLTIIEAHHAVCLYKYSMHPSSYFVVDGKLKSINYFFTYHLTEGPISIADHTSHIYSTRQEEMKKATDAMGISWTEPQPLALLEELCWESFRKNYPADFIERAKCIK
jgi:hypothetical protein